MKTITSKQIGQLTQDEDFQDWWKSNETEIPFFDRKKMTITFMNFEPDNDLKFIEEADNALLNFQRLTFADRVKLSEVVYKNYLNFLAAIGQEESHHQIEIKSATDIWKFVHPKEIYVSRRPYKEMDMYVQISCECDWEEEHGLQLVFRQGKQLTRVSDIDGHLTEADAYDKSDEEDELLSKFE
jgi:hypothetical protein